MKIYQIHKYEGEYEDYTDTIVSSYFDYNKALSEKERLEQEELSLRKQGRKCVECPFVECPFIDSWDIKKIVDKYKDYCEDLLLENTEWGINCNNYKPHWNDATFEILEVEVIE